MKEEADKVLEKIEEIYDVERIEQLLDKWWSTGGIEFKGKLLYFTAFNGGAERALDCLKELSESFVLESPNW
jgi:hypothetical protein